MKRRVFLKTLGSAAGACAFGVSPWITQAASVKRPTDTVPRRVLGRTGERLSIVGFPGLALVRYEQAECNAALQDAFERGVNHFDVAPAYGRGDAEIKMGIGLQHVPRDRIFLSCKTKMRDRDGARKELERSLQRLKTDHFDLYQLHALRRPEEVQQALGPGGAMETILKARDEGKVRFIGFSAHTTKAAVEALNHFQFDTVMFPINFVEYFRLGYGKEVLKRAAEKGAAVLAIKPISLGAWPRGMKRNRHWWYRSAETQPDIDLAFRFALSQKGVVVGIPTSFFDLFDKTVTAAQRFQPITPTERAQLEKRAQTLLSLFKREEERVAWANPPYAPIYPDSPHECLQAWRV